jgi:hypothetical protein
VKQDLRQGKEQAKQDAQLAKEKVQEQADGDTVTAPYQEGEAVGAESSGDLDPLGNQKSSPRERSL